VYTKALGDVLARGTSMQLVSSPLGCHRTLSGKGEATESRFEWRSWSSRRRRSHLASCNDGVRAPAIVRMFRCVGCSVALLPGASLVLWVTVRRGSAAQLASSSSQSPYDQTRRFRQGRCGIVDMPCDDLASQSIVVVVVVRPGKMGSGADLRTDTPYSSFNARGTNAQYGRSLG
jgi:hypothetical protein